MSLDIKEPTHKGLLKHLKILPFRSRVHLLVGSRPINAHMNGWTGPGGSQQPGAEFRSPTWVTENHELSHCFPVCMNRNLESRAEAGCGIQATPTGDMEALTIRLSNWELNMHTHYCKYGER